MAEYDAALALEPQNVSVMLDQAEAYRKLDDLGAYASVLKKAADADSPDAAVALDRLMGYYVESGLLSDAATFIRSYYKNFSVYVNEFKSDNVAHFGRRRYYVAYLGGLIAFSLKLILQFKRIEPRLPCLAVVFYMPLLRHFIRPTYWDGLGVVPIVMLAEIFMGVYFNLSFWYKLTDQTWWGAIMSAAGAAVMIAVNVIFVPKIGYWACAWGGFAGYGTAMLMSWLIGRRKYRVDYDMRSIAKYVVISFAYYHLFLLFGRAFDRVWLQLAFGTALLASYAYFVWKDIKLHKR